jgi:hypothetical protein
MWPDLASRLQSAGLIADDELMAISGLELSGPELAMHWLILAGTFLLALGSGLQAATEISDYQDLLRESGLTGVFSRALDLSEEVIAIGSAGPMNPFALFSAFRGTLELLRLTYGANRNIRWIREQDGEQARRLHRLINKSFQWLVIMVGALAVFAAAAIQLLIDYT